MTFRLRGNSIADKDPSTYVLDSNADAVQVSTRKTRILKFLFSGPLLNLVKSICFKNHTHFVKD